MSRYIDADALLERLERKKCEPAKVRYTEGFNDALMRFRSMVHGAPTVDAVLVVHSEWIDGKVIDIGGVKHKLSRTCKHCGKPSYDEPWQYCPCCGAKMDGADGERRTE